MLPEVNFVEFLKIEYDLQMGAKMVNNNFWITVPINEAAKKIDEEEVEKKNKKRKKEKIKSYFLFLFYFKQFQRKT